MKIKYFGATLVGLAMTLGGAFALNAMLAPAVNPAAPHGLQKEEAEATAYENTPATATWTLDLGTADQTATFSVADAFAGSAITVGENISVKGLDNKGKQMTWFSPAAKENAPAESNAIRFVIEPQFGVMFTPTKVSFKSTRFGTNGGNMNVSWENPDKTTVALAEGILPNRDNDATNPVSEFEYNVTGTTTTLGACALLINLYNLDAGKNVGIKDLVIEGTLTGANAETVTATWSYDNDAVKAATLALSGSQGAVISKEGNLAMTIISNGASFRDNDNNIQVRTGAEFRVPVFTTNDVVTVDGYPGYSYYTIDGGETLNGTNTYKAKTADVERGYVSVISADNNNYYYGLSVTLAAPKELATLENEAATATFAFGEGTEGQKAEFTCPDYFLASKVTYGNKVTLDGKDNKSNNQTWFGIVEQCSAPEEGNAIRFLIQPNFGLTFTPTKISFKTTRYGTDGGLVDAAWYNPDGTTVSLLTEVKPQRDNATPNMTECESVVTGATPGEGACGLQINLYSLAPGKRVGFKDIVIEGTLSGTEKEVPMLASFKANGVEYDVDDIFEAQGDTYVTTIELASSETMISAQNPVSDLVTRKGTVGTVTYEGDNDNCVVTMPVSLNEITINYVANFVRKPLFTVTYYNTDGSVMGTQEVEKDAEIGEFAVDYTTATAEDGYKVRGWFAQPTIGRKVFTTDVVTGPVSAYALATEIETESPYKKYEFKLNDPNFYPEDHEAFNTENGYFHDTTHGWAFKNGDVITLLTGPKAAVSVSLCRYGYGTTMTVTDAKGNVVATLPAKASGETDGEVAAFQYEGEGGLLTLTFASDGELYIHSVKIVNNAEVNYTSEGNWYFVNLGDAGSLLDVIDAVNAANSDRNSERTFIFVPDGVYDLRETVLTNLSGHNISLIGQSMEGTIIRNAPHYTTEGISQTATLMNTGTGLYMQDLTIQNALDYYGAQDAGLAGGRAVAFWDKGVKTAAKNVKLLSYQDTYYTNNGDGKYYWETSDIHGTVDFFCGEGTMYMANSTITVEKRKQDGTGECTITAPSTKAGSKYGYVFDKCTIVNHAAKFNYGRAWSNEPRCAYINTTHTDAKLNASRWTANGMNVAAKEFVEYKSVDADGNVISPESHVVKFIKGDKVNEMETILTDAQAAEYTVDKVFGEWHPDALCVQKKAPVATIADGMIKWEPVEGAVAYALFKDGEFVAVVSDATSYVTGKDNSVWSIRAANPQGGFGEEAIVATSGIADIDADEAPEVIYDLRGMRVTNPVKGQIYIINGKKVVK